MTEIAGKTALVTGGGSGIGRALALAAAREGASVIVADIRRDGAEEVAVEIRSVGGNAIGTACDVSDRASVRALRTEAMQALGPVELVFANAGATSFDPIDDMSDETMDWMFQVNLMGVAHCAQVFIPDMIDAGSGHFMATSSMAGLIPDLVGEHAHYAGAKLGVVGFVLGLRREIDGLGVGTTVLCPGGVKTGMAKSGSYRPERLGGPFERKRTAPAYHKVQLFRPPEEVADMVLRGVRQNRAFVVTDNTYREVFDRQYVSPVLQAFDDVAAFDAEKPGA